MIYNKLLEEILLPIGDFLNRSSYVKKLKYWRNLDELTEEELYKIQKRNLEKLLHYSVKNVPFYKGLELKGENPFDWIKHFPILTKEKLKKNEEKLLTKNRNQLIKYSSSGSSGIQSSIFMNKEEQSNVRAILTHWWEWSGYKIGQPLIQTGITPSRGILKYIKDKLFRTIYVSAFSLSEKEIIEILDKVKCTNINFYTLSGYASSLNVIALVALRHNYNINLKAVISFGDKLFTYYKKNIKKAFKCEVYDTYGCNEGFLIACQKDLDYKYIMSPHVYLEILDKECNPVPDGVMGNIVVTRLDGYSMPLIRYKIGDLGIKLPKKEYPISRNFNYPLLKQIVGRETDVIKTRKGNTLVVHSFTGIFEYFPEIRQFKVIQENLNGITIEYIKDENFKKSTLELITNELQRFIKDKSFNISYLEVKYINPTKSGKPQIIESKV